MELSINEQWEKCLRKFQDNLPPEQFNSWFRPITFLKYEDDTLHLGVPSEFFKEYLETNYLRLLTLTLRNVYGPAIKLFYHFQVVKDQPDSSVVMSGSNPSAAVTARGNAANPFVKSSAADELDSQLNPRYNFENYCQGECNRLAATIGQAICKDPRTQTYNPLFVFGPPGVGKTHLAQAIGIGIKECMPSRRVLYVTARLFESQYTAANARGKINDFIAFYQGIDTLIIDDIQDFIGKPGTQRTFFHIFNHLHLNAKQLILTSDVRPSEMDNMEERLLSRFKWGMTCELFRPDYDMRVKVLTRKSEQDGLDLPADVIEFIAENCTSSFRELEGIVVSLMTHATVENRPIDVELARYVLKNAVKIRRHSVNFEMIAEQVSSYYKIESDALFTKSRRREINDARQMVMYITKKLTSLPLTSIGARLSRTHATVLHAVHNIENRLATEPQLRADLTAIESALAPR
ncbi:MAG: chromosomal replication initiator protein DnaA [Muribaculaceae bacterium]|nr:chromosomal replication initiator protein DnaA [Muribaculaceae bacterium]MDE7111811.1 chromosomal replication initiator protein DnaA [Muribaculaceae bacterium]